MLMNLLELIYNKLFPQKKDDIYKNLSMKDKKSCEENKIPHWNENF